MDKSLAIALASRLDIRDTAIARRSTKAEPWQIVDVRELTREEAAALIAAHPGTPDPKAPLARITAPHHALARLLAEGKDHVEVSFITGYTPERVRMLEKDPSFRELVAHYEQQIVQVSVDVQGQVANLALTAAQILQDRLESTPEEFTTKELRELMTAGLDRTGHGPGKKLDLNLTETAAVIEQMRSAMRESGGRVLDRSSIIEADYEELQSEELQSDETETSSGPENGEANA